MQFRRTIVALAVAAATLSGTPLSSSVPIASATTDGWTTPTPPRRCTTAEADAGTVAGCVLMATGLPESRGWPTAPFPTPGGEQVIPWVDLTLGSSGPVVGRVQDALNAAGANLDADGSFGQLTFAAVKTYQTGQGLPSTGVVDAATATALGVQNTTGGSFPPAGWVWLGWGYNLSPALREWETRFVANTRQIGSMRPGQLRTLPDALPLFEGFYAEIQAKGYVIRNGGMYVFRCTASSGRKDCLGMTRGNLSNHSWGLASDINTVENPMRTYFMQNGRTACSTPMLTDMPRWVVQTAEKWGLYWGGYGWSSGCWSPTQAKSSVTRDPMHFEFNGTPAQARAIAERNLGASTTCSTVIDASGNEALQCLARGQVSPAGTRTIVTTGAPAGATAALVNITTTGATAKGFFTAESCGPVTGERTSTGNVRPGRAVGASAVVTLDAKGRFCLYQSGAFQTIVDVQGWFAPSASAPNGALLRLSTPVRALDTRAGVVCSPESECYERTTLPGGIEAAAYGPSPTAAVASVANITVAVPTANGSLTADSCDAITPGRQTSSNVNFISGDVAVSNLAVVRSRSTEEGEQFCTYSAAGLHETVDVHGWFVPAAAGGLAYQPSTPSRIVDTRQCRTDPLNAASACAVPLTATGVLRMRAPTGASAVLVNMTTVGGGANGGVAAGTCAALAAGGRTRLDVPVVPGAAVANMAIVPVAPDGTFCVMASTATHVIVDMTGTFVAGAGLRFTPAAPTRVHDSRPPV